MGAGISLWFSLNTSRIGKLEIGSIECNVLLKYSRCLFHGSIIPNKYLSKLVGGELLLTHNRPTLINNAIFSILANFKIIDLSYSIRVSISHFNIFSKSFSRN